MVHTKYNRSEILSFYDLTEKQQEDILCIYEQEQAEQDSFVIFESKNPENNATLPLSMFMRIDSKVWNGVYGTSYFSAYFIKFNRSGDDALIAEKYS